MPTVCDYCGKQSDAAKIRLGWKPDTCTKPEWVMWMGTGQISCPDCTKLGRMDSQISTGETKARKVVTG